MSDYIRELFSSATTYLRRLLFWRRNEVPQRSLRCSKDVVLPIINGIPSFFTEKSTLIREEKLKYCKCTKKKICKKCKGILEVHAMYYNEITSVRKHFGSAMMRDNNIDPEVLGYSWVPPGITTPFQIQKYFDHFPSEKVPILHTPGELYRKTQIMIQLPRQDLSINYCKYIPKEDQAAYEDLIALRNGIALDEAYVKEAPVTGPCVKCDDGFAKGDMIVVAPKLPNYCVWHPQCFVCSKCTEPLVDLIYCLHEGGLYCARHYSEKLKPRCNGCDELMFNGDYGNAMGKYWHLQHFCCWNCGDLLTGKEYDIRNGHAYCPQKMVN